jgi:TatD DNase family protein
MIRAHAKVIGVMHCFSAATTVFDSALDAGWYISFAGLITFKNYDRSDLVAATPPDRLLLETDSPYLAPVPHRGRRNEPAFVVETCRAAARMRGEPFERTARLVTQNARAFYRLDG